MNKQNVVDYLNRIRKERDYGKCIITRLERIMDGFHSFTEFARAADSDLLKALAEYNETHAESGKAVAAPYIGKKLYQACHDAQAYILNGNLEEKKVKEAEENRKNFEVLIERKRNPVFTIKALKSVIALAELAGAETVNLDQIFSVCDAFGVSLDSKEVDNG